MDSFADLYPAGSMPTPPAVAGAGRVGADDPAAGLLAIARRVRELSIKVNGANRRAEVIGRSEALGEMLGKIQKFARFDQPILITGESGVGKEFIAGACHLLSRRADKPFVSVNCPRDPEGNLTLSELFGHEKGSFAGATGTHKGLFETAEGGVIFLDEVSNLHPSAQTMLLRALVEKEFKALGSTTRRRCDVRVIAATNRPLRQLMVEGGFRQDLYFQLRYFPLQIPPLRERGEDWRLLAEHFLAKLNAEHGLKKSFSAASLRLLSAYPWPGNARELQGLVAMAYSLGEGALIEPRDFIAELSPVSPSPEALPTLAGGAEGDLYQRMAIGKECFWEVVQRPFLEHDLNRAQVQALIRVGLTHAHGSYRRAAEAFQISEQDYHKYMDFLRHHRLKPAA